MSVVLGSRLRLFAYFVAALLALSGAAQAQEATLTGTVTDTTGGVLPGVTVVAVGSSRVDLQACKLEYSIVSPK